MYHTVAQLFVIFDSLQQSGVLCLLSSELFGYIQTSNMMAHCTQTRNQNGYGFCRYFEPDFSKTGFRFKIILRDGLTIFC